MVRFTEWIIRYRYAVVFATISIVMILAYGTSRLSFTNDYRVFFSESNPQLKAFENLQNIYTKNDNVLFVVAPKSGNIFDQETLTAIQEITEYAWQIPYSIRVDSVTNFMHSYADQDDIIIDDLVADNPADLDKNQISHIRKIALSEPELINRLVSSDSSHAGINVTIQLPGIDQLHENPQVVEFVRQMRDSFGEKYPHIDIRLAGISLMNNAFSEASITDGKTLIPAAFTGITIMLILLLRGLSATLATMMIVMFSIASAMGIAGYLGIRLTPPSASAPIIILTIAIAGAVHLLVTMLQEIHRGIKHNDAIIESMRVNVQPIFLTSLTTSIGFLSLNSSDAPPFRDLGNISTFGVIIAFILTITFLPAVMSILPIKARHFVVGTYPMKRLGDFVVKFRTSLIFLLGVISIATIAMIPRNELNDIFVNYFDESVPFRVDTDYATQHLTGTYTISYSIDSHVKDGVNNPAFLAKVEKFANWYRDQPEVIHVSSVTDVFKRLNMNMHGDDIQYYKLPEEQDEAAQFLILYEMSLPKGRDLTTQIDQGKKATRLNITLQTISSNQILQLENRANQWMLDNMPEYVTHGASPAIMFAHIGKRNIISMLTGTTVALIMISGILIIALKSLKYGLISLIPNLFPAAAAFGVWGLVVGEVGLALSVVTAMTLGIVVDDTVHFMSKYIRARKEKNLESKEAVRYAFNNVGVALWVTSAALIVGFLILAQSSFELNSGMGLMTSLIILIALILDFLLLPPLLMKLDSSTVEQLTLAEQNA